MSPGGRLSAVGGGGVQTATVSHRIEYAAARAVQGLLCVLPGSVARELGACAGRAAYVLGVRREVVLRHLGRVFGSERRPAELRRIARKSYANFGRTVFEYARFPRLSEAAVRRTVDLTGGTHIDRALAGGRGAILVSGHFGNWEMIATLAVSGYPLTFLVGEQHNILIDRVMNGLRARFGVEIVPITGSLTGAFRALRRNRVVALLSDQDAGKHGVFVDFLGLPASTPYGPARFALATGAALLPCMVVRRGHGRHEIFVCPPVGAAGAVGPDEAARDLTQGYTSALEDFVLRYPEQYFWMHRRWKTRPPPGA